MDRNADPAPLDDLLDGRLPPEEAEAVRRRIALDPDLKAEWDDLVRLREAVRAWKTPALPGDFAERVKRAAGVGAAGAEAKAPDAAGGGRILRLRPWLYAAAAGIGVVAAIGFHTFVTSRSGEQRTAEQGAPAATARETVRDREDARDVAAVPAEQPDAPAAPRFRGPGGAIPSGLRTPSDPAKPAGPPAPPAPAAAPPPVVVPETAPPPARPEPATGHGTPPAEPPAGDKASAPSDAKRGLAAPAEGYAWAFAGVDDVLVLEASDLDGARAQVAVFLNRLHEKGGMESENGEATGCLLEDEKAAAPPASRVSRVSRSAAPADADRLAEAIRRQRSTAKAAEGATRKAPEADGDGGAATPAQPAAPGASAASGRAEPAGDRRAKKAEEAAPAPIGAFVVTLSAEEARRLDALVPDAAKGAGEKADAERLVRIVVVSPK